MWNHQICDIDLTKGMDHYAHDSRQYDTGVKIRWKASARLSGDYVFEAWFTQKDVARLFVEAFSNTSVAEALRILTEARADQAGASATEG